MLPPATETLERFEFFDLWDVLEFGLLSAEACIVDVRLVKVTVRC
jgi:hypothetical protein